MGQGREGAIEVRPLYEDEDFAALDPTGERTLATSRRVAAAPAAVFDALRDPQRLARWWGPAGFRNHFEVCEFRPGGRWLHTMEGPDGTRYPNQATFEATDPTRVVVRHLDPAFRLTVTLVEDAGGTRVGWRQTFDDPQVCRRLSPVCTPSNEQNLDRLEAELARGA
ncbi:MAG: polyketide cyclase [Comamonadaceae bacterium]|nr:MAG: polyketide cyclase [Comamonadaceae bacterium]